MNFYSRHVARDMELPKYREQLLQSAVTDLTGDPDVLALYLGGSLATGNFDLYSDIDLRVVVKSEAQSKYIEQKLDRSMRWGNVIFLKI